MKTLLVAAPLEGRSGVYRSTYDLVASARSKGYDWSALIGMRPSAPPRLAPETPGITEITIGRHGFDGVKEIRGALAEHPDFSRADVIVTLITQSDLALSRTRLGVNQHWVAYLRGLPWPARGEQSLPKSLVQWWVERRALSRADDVWATTDVLADQVRLPRRPHIVPAGIPHTDRTHSGELNSRSVAVWAGRLAVDKQPELFAEAIRLSGVPGRVYGAGPLEASLVAAAPTNLEIAGWVGPDDLWAEAGIFVGTSYREAFGRSAVEAALHGVPIVIGTTYGAAPLLVTDRELRRELVLEPSGATRWADAIGELWANDDLRRKASDHVRKNAESLTIGASVDRAVQRSIAIALA